MKKKIYFILYLSFVTHLCFGQTIPFRDNKTKFKFLYIVNFHDKPPITSENVFINPLEEDTTYALTTSDYKEIGRLLKIDGIIYSRVKPGTKLLTLNEVFDKYKVQKKYRKFAIRVDDDLIYFPETILISANVIDKVKIVNNLKAHYINIIAKGYYQVKQEHEKAKRKREVFIQ